MSFSIFKNLNCKISSFLARFIWCIVYFHWGKMLIGAIQLVNTCWIVQRVLLSFFFSFHFLSDRSTRLVLNLVLCYPQKLDINEMPFLLTEVLKAKRYVCMEVHCKLVHNVSCPKNRKYKILHCSAVEWLKEYMYLKEKTVDEKKRRFQIVNKERIPLRLESFRQPGNSPFSVPHLIGFTHNLMFLQQRTG